MIVSNLIFNRIKCIPSQDLDLINLFLNYKCSIFGGYLRDIISGCIPSDFDVLVQMKHADKLISELTVLGYKFSGDVNDLEPPNIIVGNHSTLREIDLHFCEKLPGESYIYSDLLPDIDINALALGNIKKEIILYNWHKARDPNIQHDLPLIITDNSILIQNIKDFKMRIINEDDINKKRLDKYIAKGYSFVS